MKLICLVLEILERKIYHPRVLSKEDNILVLTNTEASKSINRLKKI